MRRLLPYIFTCLLMKMSLAAHGNVIVEARIVPEEAYLGQRVILQIDVLGSEGWTKLRRLPQIDVAGAYVVQTNSQGVRLQETVQGVGYTGQRYEYSIYPQRAGTIEIPVLTVETESSSWGSQTKESVESADTPALSFESLLPPGAEGLSWLVSTTSMIVQQEWNSGKEDFNIGDAVRRTIILEAENLPGMAFPEIVLAAPDGMRAYPHESTIEDFINRGTQRGKRIDSTTFIIEEPGILQLPDLEFHWWNLRSEKLIREILPGRIITVQQPAVVAGEETLPVNKKPERNRIVIAVIAALAGAVIWVFRKRFQNTFSAWRTVWHNSERARFGRIGKADRRHDSRAVLSETMAWLDFINEDHQPARLDRFLKKHRPGTDWESISPVDLYKVLKEARKEWRKSNNLPRMSKSGGTLPGLNP